MNTLGGRLITSDGANSLLMGQKGKISNGVNPRAYLTDTSDRFASGTEPIVL